MRSHTAIALSGGIDSLVAAALLKDQGRDLIGVHFLHGFEAGHTGADLGGDHAFNTLEDHARRTMKTLSEQLDIPIQIVDLRTAFKNHVVDYFVNTYRSGKTPNPCLVCNPAIKFDVLLEKARTWGACEIASGHYARIDTGPDGRMRLLRGIDPQKDQSYFLARLSQSQLASAVLPLGTLTKAKTRRIARRKGLVPVSAVESQDICFIKDGAYGDFLARQPGFTAAPGPIEDMRGKVVGRHNGLHRFTIGQRRGINCPAAEPFYVVRIDHPRNCLCVGTKEDLLRHSCRVGHINWIAAPPGSAVNIQIRVRYRHKAVGATLIPAGANEAEIHFDAPEPAVAPGQGAVFYQEDEVIGGGWIE